MGTDRHETYQIIDGVSVLVDVQEFEIQTPSNEELIAEKEAQLLAMYEDLQALKNNK